MQKKKESRLANQMFAKICHFSNYVRIVQDTLVMHNCAPQLGDRSIQVLLPIMIGKLSLGMQFPFVLHQLHIPVMRYFNCQDASVVFVVILNKFKCRNMIIMRILN